VLHKLILRLLLGVQLLELLNERFGHRDQRLLGPGQEPVYRALVEQSGEFAEAVSELLTDWGEAEADVEVISNSIYEVGVELARCGVCSFELLNVVVPRVSEESFFLVLGEQAGDLASGEDHVNVLEELLLLDLGVSEDEAAVLAEAPSDLKILLDVFLEVLLGIIFHQLDLLVLHALDEG